MDKILHYAVCFFITALVAHVMVAFGTGKLTGAIVGAIVAEIIGLGKEMKDESEGRKFDKKDLLADNLGIVSGFTCCLFL